MLVLGLAFQTYKIIVMCDFYRCEIPLSTIKCYLNQVVLRIYPYHLLRAKENKVYLLHWLDNKTKPPSRLSGLPWQIDDTSSPKDITDAVSLTRVTQPWYMLMAGEGVRVKDRVRG